MALSFPASPSVNDTFTSGARTWTWSGTIWEITGSIAAAGSVGPAELAANAVTSAKLATSISLTGTPLAPTPSAGTNTTQIATTAFVAEAIPVASLQMFAGAVTQTVASGVVTTTAPSGWLLCNGNAVSRTTYSTLFASVSTTYGVGDGTTTFNLPDMRSRMPIGTGTGTGLTARTLAGTGGVETVTLTSAQSGVPAHTHAFSIGNVSNFTGIVGSTGHGGTIRDTGNTEANTAANASAAHDNMSPYLGVNFIIKAL